MKRRVHGIVRMACATAAACLLVGSASAAAADFPAKPVRIVVAFAPGGNIDITARTIAPGLSEFLGQTVLVDNRGGAGGRIGSALVAKSPPDGYTVLLGAEVMQASPEEFAARVKADYQKWLRIRKETGIKVD